MKIAIVHNLPSGGAKVVLYKWIEELRKRHTVDEYCLSSSDIEFYDTKGIPHSRVIFKYKRLKRFPPDNKFQYLNFIFSFFDIFSLENVYKNIASYINAKDYNIVLTTHDRFIQSPLCQRWLRTPVIYYIHEPLRPYEVREGIGQHGIVNSVFNFLYPKYIGWLDKINTRAASRILVNSKNTQKNVSNMYGIRSQVCYPGVDTKLFHPLNIKKENFILSVGALDPVKGHDFIIKSVAEVDKHIRPVIKIAYDRGVEKYKTHLLTLAKERNVNISFISRVRQQELNMFYNKALFVVCAQKEEPFGFIPLEAMACGTPVIAVNEGGFKETVINGKTGILVEREPYEFASAITLLLTDKEIRKKYSKDAYKWIINNWSWELHIKKLEENFRQWIVDSRK